MFLVFGILGPPTGFVATVIGATAFMNTPEGLDAILYGLNPFGLALIYAAGLAPALATAAALVLLEERGFAPGVIAAALTGFTVTLAYGVVATTSASVAIPMAISLALAGVGTIAAIACMLIARQVPKLLAENDPPR